MHLGNLFPKGGLVGKILELCLLFAHFWRALHCSVRGDFLGANFSFELSLGFPAAKYGGNASENFEQTFKIAADFAR